MRTAIFHRPGKPVTIECREVSRPGSDDVLIKVCRCGVCGSDISMTGDVTFTYDPGPIGHEYAGEVVEFGRNVSGLHTGQRVACLPITGCGICAGCLTGNATFCVAPRKSADGATGFGGFGEYVTIPSAGVISLPDSLSFSDGALVEPMACGLHAMRMARMEKGANVLVLGAGTMALSVIYWARRLGAGRITVLSRSLHRSDVVHAMGADEFCCLENTDHSEALHSSPGGRPDIVAECVGKEGMLGRAIGYVRPQGSVISLGMCQRSEPLTPALGTFNELRLLFPLAYTRGEFIETVRAFDAGKVRPDMMVSDVISLEALPDMLEAMRAGTRQGLKVHVDPRLELNNG